MTIIELMHTSKPLISPLIQAISLKVLKCVFVCVFSSISHGNQYVLLLFYLSPSIQVLTIVTNNPSC